MKKEIEIKKMADMDDNFKLRLYSFINRNFKEENLFYNNDYFKDLIFFCDKNNIKFNLSEYLAFNFYFFSKSQNLNTTLYLNKYLKYENQFYKNKIINIQINKARNLIKYLFNDEEGIEIPEFYKNSVNKLKDIFNLFYVYEEQQFEKLFYNKINDDYLNQEYIIEYDELLMSNILNIEKKDKVFKTEKFYKILENKAQKNLDHIIYYNKEEITNYKNKKRSLC